MIMRENMALRLNEIRKERGLSITQFSEELGIARSSLQALLSGKALLIFYTVCMRSAFYSAGCHSGNNMLL